jgi:hypothetical protein
LFGSGILINLLESLDFSGLALEDAAKVKAVISRRENFNGYVPEDGFAFIIRNYQQLAALGVLEASMAGCLRA